MQRKQDLEDSLQAQQYFADANEAESWMKEKEPIAANTDYGKDEDSAEVGCQKINKERERRFKSCLLFIFVIYDCIKLISIYPCFSKVQLTLTFWQNDFTCII